MPNAINYSTIERRLLRYSNNNLQSTIDGLYGPWYSINEFLTFLGEYFDSTPSESLIPNGATIGVIQEDGTIKKLEWRKPTNDSGSWIQVGEVISVNGKKGTVNLVPSDIGLGNVDNTADANKNVNSAVKDGNNNNIASTYETKTDAQAKISALTKTSVGLENVDNTADNVKIVKGANEDGSGNNIATTYETKADATTKQTGLQTAISAIQTTVNNLVGLEGTNFAGFSVDTTEADALTAIPTKYTTDGYTNELVWYLVGDGIDNLKAYSYDGTNTPVLVSSKVYDFTDFSGVAADISTLRQDLDALGLKIDGTKVTPEVHSFQRGWIGYDDHEAHASTIFQPIVGFPVTGASKVSAKIYNPTDSYPAVISFFSASFDGLDSLPSTIANSWIDGIRKIGSVNAVADYDVDVPAGAVYCLITSRNGAASDIVVTIPTFVSTSDFNARLSSLRDDAHGYTDGKISEVNANITSISGRVDDLSSTLYDEPVCSSYFDDASLLSDISMNRLFVTNGSNAAYRGKKILGMRVLARASGSMVVIKGTDVHIGDSAMSVTDVQTFDVSAGENTLMLNEPIVIQNDADYLGIRSAVMRYKGTYSSTNVGFIYLNSSTGNVTSTTKDCVVAIICSTIPVEDIDVETRLNALSITTRQMYNLSHLPFVEHPYYYHWSPNGFTDGIPSQSVEDNALAKRLGFGFVEINSQPTATSGKYIVTHGNGGNFGAEFDANYANVAISSMTYDDIVANVRYNSPKVCYNHVVSTLDGFLKSCATLGLGVMLRASQTSLINTVRKYLRDEYIMLVGAANVRETFNFGGMLTSYITGNGSAEICNVEYLRNYANARGGAPYHFVFNGTAIEYMMAQGTLEDIVTTLRGEGIYIGGCYATTKTLAALTAVGGCGHAADKGHCNPFGEANVGSWSSVDSSIDDWTIPEGITVSGGRLINDTSSSLTIYTPSTGMIQVGKGQLEARVSGIVVFSFGYATSGISYTDEDILCLPIAGMNMDMRLKIVISANSSVEYLNYKVSRC